MSAVRTETWEMVHIHDQFRREFAAIPDLVRGVPAGNTARAAIVAHHARLVTDFLHNHHVTEDKLLWPKLLERCPDELDQDLIHRMEAQHARVAELITQIHSALQQWTTTGDTTDRDQVADLFEELNGPLDEHLREEEERILPLVEDHVTPEEWAALGKEGAAHIPMDRMMLMLGSMLAHEGPYTARVYASLPLPVRVLYRLRGRRAYTRYMRTLNGD